MASKPASHAKTAAAPKTVAKKPGKAVATAKASAPPSAARKSAAKPTRTAAPKKVAETVTLKTVFEQLAEANDLPKKQAQSLLTGFVASVTGILQNGDRLRMNGLGVMEVKDRPARMGRNSCHRCGGADRRQQEGGVPGCQGTEGGGLKDHQPYLARPRWRVGREAPRREHWSARW
jgi:DNA-binding protein HU-beta